MVLALIVASTVFVVIAVTAAVGYVIDGSVPEDAESPLSTPR